MKDVTRMTVAQLRGLYALATQGEWRTEPTKRTEPDGDLDVVACLDWDAEWFDVSWPAEGLQPQDAMLIAAMHNTLPALLNELERLQNLEADLLGAIVRIGNAMNRDDE